MDNCIGAFNTLQDGLMILQNQHLQYARLLLKCLTLYSYVICFFFIMDITFTVRWYHYYLWNHFNVAMTLCLL